MQTAVKRPGVTGGSLFLDEMYDYQLKVHGVSDVV